MILPTYGFGIPNLLAFGNETKYFPEQFIKDMFPNLRADEITRKFCYINIDGDVLIKHNPNGNSTRYYVDIKHNKFKKIY